MLFSALTELSTNIVPTNSAYDEFNFLVDNYHRLESIALGSNCCLRLMYDSDRPKVPGQNQSFIKLGIQFPGDGLSGWDPIFIVMLVDFIDGVIPVNYKPRIYQPGLDELINHLSTTAATTRFLNSVSRTAALPSTMSISEVERFSDEAQVLL